MPLSHKLSKSMMLGSARANLDDLKAALPKELAEMLQGNASNSREEELLHIMSLALPYIKAGSQAPQFTKATTKAEEEKLAYASHPYADLYHQIEREGTLFLLKSWLKKLTQANKVCLPHQIPSILSSGHKNKELIFYVQQAIGKRGKWLAQQDSRWRKMITPLEESWEFGSFSIRQQAFQSFLTISPQLAIDKYTAAASSLSAKERAWFFERITPYFSAEHLPLIESALKDRSKVVQHHATISWTKIPGTSSYEFIKETCQKIFEKDSQGLNAISPKILIHPIDLPPELIKQLGIDEESLDNSFTNQEYQIFQFIWHIPPALLSQQLDAKPIGILKTLAKDKSLQKYIPALIQAIINYADNEWAMAYFELADKPPKGVKDLLAHGQAMLEILSPSQLKQLYLNNKISWLKDHELDTLNKITEPWDHYFSDSVLLRLKTKYMHSGVYYALQGSMVQLAEWISPEVLPNLKKYLPPHDERKESWRQAMGKLFRHIELTQKINTTNP
ncbi:MAG: DUF5691 domain-containing protein [Bacteroidota bacterium]